MRIIIISSCSQFVNLYLNVLTIFFDYFLVLSSNCTIVLCVMNIFGNRKNGRPQDTNPAGVRSFCIFYYLAVKLTVSPDGFITAKIKAHCSISPLSLSKSSTSVPLTFLSTSLSASFSANESFISVIGFLSIA